MAKKRKNNKRRKKLSQILDIEKLTADECERLYHDCGMSQREIGAMYGVGHQRISDFMNKNGIITRSVSDSLRLRYDKERADKVSEARAILAEDLKKINIKRRKFTPQKRSHILVPLSVSDDKDAVITLNMSDLHIGDSNFLPDTYKSAVINAAKVIEYLVENYRVKQFNIVLNGDIVSGRNVFRHQELRNLLERGHWQVFMAEYLIKDTLEKFAIPVDMVYLTRGTHEALSNNFVLYLKRMLGDKSKYLSHSGLVNIAYPLEEYNVLYTHGMSSSSTSPVPPRLIDDCLGAVSDYKSKNIDVERVCTGHTHWLSSNMIIGNVYWDVTGGFQKWEYTVHQRPSGMILYLYNNKEVSSMPIRPDPQIEEEEKNEVGLEYKNLVFYGGTLLKHLKEIELREK